MRILIKKDNATILCVLFGLLILCELALAYSMISRIALVLFVGMVFVCSFRIRWSFFLTGYAAFTLFSFFNIFTGHAASESEAMAMTRTLLLNLLFLMAMTNFCKYIGDSGKILQIYKWIVICVTVVCLPVGIYGNLSTGTRALKILGINVNELAMQAAFVSLIQIDELVHASGARQKIRGIILLVLLVGMILISGSRKGLLIPLIGVYIMLCFNKPRRFLIYTLAILAGCAVVLYLMLNVDSLYTLIGFRVEALLQYLSGETFTEASLASRSKLIQLGWESAKNSPFWGHGVNCYHLLPGAFNTYSHSNYIEILYSLGWTGLVLYYLPYLWGLLQVPNAVKTDRRGTALVTAILVPLLICEYMNVTYFTRLSLILPLILLLQINTARRSYEINTAN